MSEAIQGRIVWHDLSSTNPDASRRFYGELFGWHFADQQAWCFMARGEEPDAHFGTLMKQEAPGAPSLWVPYLAVTDIDGALGSARAAGGRVLVPKTPAGSTGHFSYVFDPQGALSALWQYAAGRGKPEHEGPPAVGSFCWDELLTSDPAAARAYYGAVVGYGAETMPMPGMEYTLLLRDALGADGKRRQAAGLMKLPEGVPHPFWLPYVAVADCDASVARARALGATTPMEPISMPNIGRFTTLIDPTGAAIGVLGPTA